MNNRDFIPRKDKDLLEWATNFLAVLASILPRIEFPADEHARLTTLLNTFRTKLAIADAPTTRTEVTVLDKNIARKALVKESRQAVGEYITRNHRVTDTDRDALGVPIHKTTRDDAPVATTYPDFDIDSGTIRRLIIHFFDQGKKKSSAKPEGQHGAEIRWGISDTPVVDVEELTHSSFDTNSPLTLEFKGHERGKTVYFCLCWENTTGKKGPWSEIQSAIIP